jgi:DUF1680 family protein
MTVSLVVPSPSATGALRPLSAEDVELRRGFWAERVRVNRERTIPHGLEQLRAWGTLDNLRTVAAGGGTYRAGQDTSGATFPFLDSDVYKWLEAVGWELGRRDDPGLASAAGQVIELVAGAQRPDGYLNSYVQLNGDGVPARDLAWGHELYCIGHLIQAAVAWHRAVRDDRLLAIARRAADWADRELGPAGRDGIDGHPEIEPALVELYRVTGEPRYLALAARMIDLRGHGLLGAGRFGPTYWQDHLPVREAASVAGHVVRQMYLDCGAVDVAVETGDAELLAAVLRRRHDMVSTRSYLTGALGSRHKDEAFGEPYELPPDRAYAETCAAIGSVMLGWRLLLATGDETHADAIERTMFNAVLAGAALDGTRFFYVNPLQRRTNGAEEPGHGERAPWYPCACCPPNLMRTLSSWQQYLATSNDSGVQVHQYAAGRLRAQLPAGEVVLSVETAYPWDGRITVQVDETPDRPWTLSLRVPGWCTAATFSPPGEAAHPVTGSGVAECRRTWRAGDRVTLDLDLAVRVVEPHHRVDAVRGCVAVERGPLVYCVESVDLPPGVDLEELDWDPERGPEVGEPSLFGGSVTAVDVPLSRRDGAAGAGSGPQSLRVPAVPYFAWAHRGPGAMRVWIPRRGA